MGKLGIARRSLGPHTDLGCRVLMQLELRGLRSLPGQSVPGCGLWTSNWGLALPLNQSPSCHTQTVRATQVAMPRRERPYLLSSKAGKPEPVAGGLRPGQASQTPAVMEAACGPGPPAAVRRKDRPGAGPTPLLQLSLQPGYQGHWADG